MKKEKHLRNLLPYNQENCLKFFKTDNGLVLSQSLCNLNFEFSQETMKKYDQNDHFDYYD